LATFYELLGPAVTLGDISTGVDGQRSIPGSSPWHFVNVPITECRCDPNYGAAIGCTTSKSEHFKPVLQDPKAGKNEKQQALRFPSAEE